MHILLAEDDTNISIIMQLCLERIGGHSVVHCADGKSALERAGHEKFDLVILDGMMPEMNGLEVARQLRVSGHSVPIIFLSAKSDSAAIGEFTAIGTGFIAKPFDPQTICGKIDDIMSFTHVRAA